MSTRGAYGFRIGEQDKATYNHSDSYPTYLGNSIMQFIHDTPDTELKEIANRIELVNENSKPTPEQVEVLKKYSDTGVGTGSLSDWYCLLRETQGDLTPYKNGLRQMMDYQLFLQDSLFCEWAYIINLDTETLEIYRGLNTRKTANKWGRYAGYSVKEASKGRDKYFGVYLFKTVKLEHIRQMTAEAIAGYCQAIEDLIYKKK